MKKEYSASHWNSLRDPAESLRLYLNSHQSSYNRTKDTLVKKLLGPDLKSKTILDYGCGGGLFSVYMAGCGAHVAGIDASEPIIQAALLHALQKGVQDRCRFIVSETLPSGPETYDVILLKDVLEHIEDDRDFAWRIPALLKERGELIVSTQNSHSLNYLLDGLIKNKLVTKNPDWCGWDSTHQRFYNSSSLNKMFSERGLEFVSLSSVYIIPYDVLKWPFFFLPRRWRTKLRLDFLCRFDGLCHDWPVLRNLGWGIIMKFRKKS